MSRWGPQPACGSVSNANVRSVCERLVGALQRHALPDGDRVDGGPGKRARGHEHPGTTVPLEAAGHLRRDLEVRRDAADPILVEGELEAGVDRDARRPAARQGSDDLRRLRRPEDPRSGKEPAGAQREPVVAAGFERLRRPDRHRGLAGPGLRGERDRRVGRSGRPPGSAAGVAVRLRRVNVARCEIPWRYVFVATSSATGVTGGSSAPDQPATGRASSWVGLGSAVDDAGIEARRRRRVGVGATGPPDPGEEAVGVPTCWPTMKAPTSVMAATSCEGAASGARTWKDGRKGRSGVREVGAGCPAGPAMLGVSGGAGSGTLVGRSPSFAISHPSGARGAVSRSSSQGGRLIAGSSFLGSHSR